MKSHLVWVFLEIIHVHCSNRSTHELERPQSRHFPLGWGSPLPNTLLLHKTYWAAGCGMELARLRRLLLLTGKRRMSTLLLLKLG